MTTPCYVLLGFTCVTCLAFLILLKADYRRLTMERENMQRYFLFAEDCIHGVDAANTVAHLFLHKAKRACCRVLSLNFVTPQFSPCT